MRKHLAILLTVFALTLPMASPAAAEGFDLNPDDCGFPVHLELLQYNAKERTITSRSGDPRFTLTNGAIKVRLTHMPNGPSIDLNISGPGKINGTQDLWTIEGTWLIFLDQGPVQGAPNNSRLFLVTGRAEMTIDANRNTTGFRLLAGHAEDLCSKLT
jgi:hypothetical protein